MVMGMVAVSPRILPDTTGDRAELAHRAGIAKQRAVSSAQRILGSVTVQNTRQPEAPSVSAPSSVRPLL